MKERPILFSAPMVKALLAGTKTQTRRIVKPLHGEDVDLVAWHAQLQEWVPWLVGQMLDGIRCPYGVAGDRLWVRESWRLVDFEHCDGRWSCAVQYLADGATGPRRYGGAELTEERLGGRPSIHMLRAESRIALEVTSVRVERLQDISEDDARAEGVDGQGPCGYTPAKIRMGYCRYDYAALWDGINGDGAWASNPWVWVVSFKRVAP